MTRRGGIALAGVAIIAGLVLSFTAFTLFGVWLLRTLGLPEDLLRNVAIALLFLVVATLLFPKVEEIVQRPFLRLTRRPSGDRRPRTRLPRPAAAAPPAPLREGRTPGPRGLSGPARARNRRRRPPRTGPPPRRGAGRPGRSGRRVEEDPGGGGGHASSPPWAP